MPWKVAGSLAGPVLNQYFAKEGSPWQHLILRFMAFVQYCYGGLTVAASHIEVHGICPVLLQRPHRGGISYWGSWHLSRFSRSAHVCAFWVCVMLVYISCRCIPANWWLVVQAMVAVQYKKKLKKCLLKVLLIFLMNFRRKLLNELEHLYIRITM